jgi:hypothetical protein
VRAKCAALPPFSHHRGDPLRPRSHGYSLDGLTWLFGGVAYTNNVTFTDGSSLLLTRRERPHVVFAEGTRTIVALSNSAMVGGAYGDRSFTLVQGVR